MGLLWLVFGCKSLLDADGDGAVAGPDCDDTNPAISPDAVERCDGVDEDCDGAIDDDAADATRFYIDGDRDSWGDSDNFMDACSVTSDLVALRGGDCDDADPERFPGGEEICDDRDNDCDGVVNPGTSAGAETFYADRDGDRYGDVRSPELACELGPGLADDATDCDDTNPDAHPGWVEQCDGFDNDCDRLVDDDDPSALRLSWYPDEDADGFGDEDATPTYACTGPDGWVTVAGDCDDRDDRRNPDGRDCQISRYPDETDIGFGATRPDEISDSSWATDLDFDGETDYLVSVWQWSWRPEGAVFVVFGPVTGESILDAKTIPTMLDDDTLTEFGLWMGSAGDADGDGIEDVGILAKRGGLDVFALPLHSGDGGGSRSARLVPVEADSDLSSARGGFDFDGDGYQDLAVGSAAADREAGAVYVAFGPNRGTTSLADADALLDADVPDGAGFGAALAAADFDADGLGDLAVGAPFGTGGSIYLAFGGTSGALTLADPIVAEGADTHLGATLAAGDADGDGHGDLLASAPGYGLTGYRSSGKVYLLSAPEAASELADATASFVGLADSDRYGSRLGDITDLDGDGFGDLVIGSDLDRTCSYGAGAVFVLYGPTTGDLSCTDADVILRGDMAAQQFSRGLATPGDLDGDGLGEILAGAADTGSSGGPPMIWVFDGRLL